MGILDDALNLQDAKRSQRLKREARKSKIEANKIKEGTYRGIDLVDGTAKMQLDDQTTTTSGYKLITNAPLGDGDRVSIRPNGLGLPRADAKNVAPKIAVDEVENKLGQIKTLYLSDKALFIGGDRQNPTKIYAMTDLVSTTDSHISATGVGINDWIVTAVYSAHVEDITDNERYKFVTITPKTTYEEYGSLIYLFTKYTTGDWIIPFKSFKVGDEVHLSVNADSNSKVYVRAVTPIIDGFIRGYSIGYSVSPTGTIITVSSDVYIRLAKIFGLFRAGYGWAGDVFFGSSFNKSALSQIGEGNFVLIGNRIGTYDFNTGYEDDSIVFFKKTISSVLPSPLIENKKYIAKNNAFNPLTQLSSFEVYDGNTPITLSGSTSQCWVTSGLIDRPKNRLEYNFLLQSFSQLNPFYSFNPLNGLDVVYNMPLNSTNAIANVARYFYINSLDLGISGVYFVPDFTFVVQGKDLKTQIVAKTTVTKTSDPDNDFIDTEYRLYTESAYVVIGTDYFGYPADIYPEKQIRVFSNLSGDLSNLIGNKVISNIESYISSRSGSANIVAYKVGESSAIRFTSKAFYTAIPSSAIILSISAYTK